MLALTREKWVEEILQYFGTESQLKLIMMELVGSYYQQFMTNQMPPEQLLRLRGALGEITLDGARMEIIRDQYGRGRIVGVADSEGFRAGRPPFNSVMYPVVYEIKLKNGKVVTAARKLVERLFHRESLSWQSPDVSGIISEDKVVGWRELSSR